MPDDPKLVAMRRRAAAMTVSVGRNEPCPCGSGRKSKHCHQGQMAISGTERAAWVLDKARTHVVTLAPTLLESLAGTEDHPDAVELTSLDIILFDGGGLQRFLRSRGSQLPADEVSLIEAWIAGHRASVYRIDAIEAGPGSGAIGLTDQSDRRRFSVDATAAWDHVDVDDLVWCRLLPVDGAWRSSGVVRAVRLKDRETLIQAVHASAEEHLDALLGRDPERRPVLDADGEPVVSARTSWRVPAAMGEVEAVLDGVAERQDRHWVLTGDGQAATTVTVHPRRSADEAGPTDDDTTDGDRQVTLDPDGVRLLTDSSSVRRHQRATALVADLFPSATDEWSELIPAARSVAQEDDEEVLMAFWAECDDADAWDDEDDDELDGEEAVSPELQAAVDAFAADFERRWVDDPLPVLGGRSPRQAAADPEHVADLRTLLREFDRRDSAMDADHLRDLLDLDLP